MFYAKNPEDSGRRFRLPGYPESEWRVEPGDLRISYYKRDNYTAPSAYDLPRLIKHFQEFPADERIPAGL